MQCLAPHLTVSFCSVIAILQAGGFLFASPDCIPRMTEHLKGRTKLNRTKSPGTQAVLLSPSPRPQREHLVSGQAAGSARGSITPRSVQLPQGRCDRTALAGLKYL